MNWPWGTSISQIQAEETAKLLLNLCQATIIGSVGLLFIAEIDGLRKIMLFILGGIVTTVLFMIAMKLFKGVKHT